MLDFTEKVPSTKFPLAWFPDTRIVSDNLPVTECPTLNHWTDEEIEEFNRTHTEQALLPYQKEPVYVQTEDEG